MVRAHVFVAVVPCWRSCIFFESHSTGFFPPRPPPAPHTICLYRHSLSPLYLFLLISLLSGHLSFLLSMLSTLSFLYAFWMLSLCYLSTHTRSAKVSSPSRITRTRGNASMRSSNARRYRFVRDGSFINQSPNIILICITSIVIHVPSKGKTYTSCRVSCGILPLFLARKIRTASQPPLFFLPIFSPVWPQSQNTKLLALGILDACTKLRYRIPRHNIICFCPFFLVPVFPCLIVVVSFGVHRFSVLRTS